MRYAISEDEVIEDQNSARNQWGKAIKLAMLSAVSPPHTAI
jgi:hypothetical protein